MYNFFFTQANFAALEKYLSACSGGLYTHFIPPWYKGDFDAVQGLYFSFEVNVVMQRRLLRNSNGFEKMRLTLASMYDLEPNFCKEQLDYILSYVV